MKGKEGDAQTFKMGFLRRTLFSSLMLFRFILLRKRIAVTKTTKARISRRIEDIL